MSSVSLKGMIRMNVILLALSGCSDSDSQRVSRVENGLLPLVATTDQLGVRSSITQRMRHYGVPGISVAVFENGRIVWAEGYGIARDDGDMPVTEATLFQAASISKPVTAVGALRLVQDGILNLDKDVNASLTSWQVPQNQFTQDGHVTLRGLLNHSAGITVHGFPGYSVDSTIPPLEDVLNGEVPANTARVEVDVPIDSEWRYSGGGYTIVQQLLIDVTRQPFQRFMADSVLRPMGMANSTFEQPLTESRSAGAASGHQPGLGPVVGSYHVYPEMAAAGLWTTATDLALFAIGVHEATVGKPTSILDRTTAGEMLAPQKGNYGLGVEISGDGPSRRFSHSGINEGFDSMLVAYSEFGTGATVMTNSNLSSGLISEIIGSIAEEYEWPDYPFPGQREYLPFSDEQLKEYPGTYDLGDGFVVSVVREGEGLLMSVPNQGQTDIYSRLSGDSQFVTGFPFPPFQFVPDETGYQIQFLPPQE
jgi:CubicO group peptidase (beta-lactamase class C family)